MKVFNKALCLTAALLSALAATSSASIVISHSQVGDDVVFTYSGSLDLTGLSYDYNIGGTNNKIVPVRGQISFNGNSSSNNYGYDMALTYGYLVYGTAGNVYPTSCTGDYLNFDCINSQAVIYVTKTYDGGEISGTMTFEDSTYDSLGMDPNSSYGLYTLSNGEYVIVVPEPSDYAAMSGVGILLGAMLMRMKKKVVALK